MSYFKFIRKVHNYASITIFVFILFYVLSGFILIRHDFFPHGEAREEVLSYKFTREVDTTNYVDFLNRIKSTYKLKGRTEEIVVLDSMTYRTWIVTPGVWNELTFFTEKDTLTIKKRINKSFGRVISRVHLLRDFHGGIKYIIWSVLYDIAAVSFLIFSFTGVLIWFKLRKSMKPGWIFLAGGFLFTMVIIVMLMK